MKFNHPVRYQGSTFILRPFHKEDTDALHRVMVESHDHLKPWLDFIDDQPQAPERTEGYIDRAQAEWNLLTDFALGIFAADNQDILGATGYHLRQRSLESRYAEIGMWIAAKHSGKGLGQKVLKALVDWGFSDWDWMRLEWCCDPRNIASRRTALAVGFRHEGTMRCQQINRRRTWIDRDVFAKIKYDRLELEPPFKVEPLQLVDAAAAAQLTRDSWLDSFEEFMAPDQLERATLAILEQTWCQKIANPATFNLGVRDHRGQWLGVLCGGTARDDGVDHGVELYSLSVAGPYQGLGLGGLLLNAFRQCLGQAGVSQAYCWCFVGNKKAMSFYQRNHCRPLNRTKRDRGGLEGALQIYPSCPS